MANETFSIWVHCNQCQKGQLPCIHCHSIARASHWSPMSPDASHCGINSHNDCAGIFLLNIMTVNFTIPTHQLEWCICWNKYSNNAIFNQLQLILPNALKEQNAENPHFGAIKLVYSLSIVVQWSDLAPCSGCNIASSKVAVIVSHQMCQVLSVWPREC